MPRKHYKTEIFNAIFDSLLMHLSRPKDPHKRIIKKLTCLTTLKEKIKIWCKSIFLQKIYTSDLDDLKVEKNPF